MPKVPCNAPCIIHNDHGFTALFCTLEKFHADPLHTHTTKDGVTVAWRYGGVSEMIRKHALPSSHCRGRLGVLGVRLALDLAGAPLGVESHYFDCEKPNGAIHKRHVRRGMYEPLGIEYTITWPL
jgi:hypothetical protein